LKTNGTVPTKITQNQTKIENIVRLLSKQYYYWGKEENLTYGSEWKRDLVWWIKLLTSFDFSLVGLDDL